MARIVEGTIVVEWADGGTHELLLHHAQDLKVRRVRRPRRPWRRQAREDLIVTFVAAGPAGTFTGAPQTVDLASGEDPGWLEHIDSLPREDHRPAA